MAEKEDWDHQRGLHLQNLDVLRDALLRPIKELSVRGRQKRRQESGLALTFDNGGTLDIKTHLKQAGAFSGLCLAQGAFQPPRQSSKG